MAEMRRRTLEEDEPKPLIPASVVKNIKRLDIYPKLEEDYQVKTDSGGVVSVVSAVIIFILFCSEVSTYLWSADTHHVVVDPHFDQRLQVNFDIHMHALPCNEISLDAMDVAGEQQSSVSHNMVKTRVDAKGYKLAHNAVSNVVKQKHTMPKGYCGSCYGAGQDGECCNTCDEIKEKYRIKGWSVGDIVKKSEQCVREGKPATGAQEGCILKGHISVNKVAGNIHIAMGETIERGSRHIHKFSPTQFRTYNASHTIRELSFGKPFPGMKNPLSGTSEILIQDPKSRDPPVGVFQYFVKLVPTSYINYVGFETYTNQYTVSKSFRPAYVNGMRTNILPGVFFVYDFSPFMVKVDATGTNFFQFLTGLCAIVGGVFTITGIVDSVIYHVGKHRKNRFG